MHEKSNLFAYGTLMWTDVLESVIGRRLQGEPAVLTGYRRLCVIGACYPVLVPSAGGSVEGQLYQGIEQGDMESLDAYEGSEYNRVGVWVKGVPAQVYVLSPLWMHIADSRPWFPEMLNPEQAASFIQ